MALSRLLIKSHGIPVEHADWWTLGEARAKFYEAINGIPGVVAPEPARLAKFLGMEGNGLEIKQYGTIYNPLPLFKPFSLEDARRIFDSHPHFGKFQWERRKFETFEEFSKEVDRIAANISARKANKSQNAHDGTIRAKEMMANPRHTAEITYSDLIRGLLAKPLVNFEGGKYAMPNISSLGDKKKAEHIAFEITAGLVRSGQIHNMSREMLSLLIRGVLMHAFNGSDDIHIPKYLKYKQELLDGLDRIDSPVAKLPGLRGGFKELDAFKAQYEGGIRPQSALIAVLAKARNFSGKSITEELNIPPRRVNSLVSEAEMHFRNQRRRLEQ